MHCVPCLLYTSIARALAAAPAIILADEPTGNLDSKTSQDVLSLLKVTSQKFAQTIVMITHNEDIAQGIPTLIQPKGLHDLLYEILVDLATVQLNG